MHASYGVAEISRFPMMNKFPSLYILIIAYRFSTKVQYTWMTLFVRMIFNLYPAYLLARG